MERLRNQTTDQVSSDRGMLPIIDKPLPYLTCHALCQLALLNRQWSSFARNASRFFLAKRFSTIRDQAKEASKTLISVQFENNEVKPELVSLFQRIEKTFDKLIKYITSQTTSPSYLVRFTQIQSASIQREIGYELYQIENRFKPYTNDEDKKKAQVLLKGIHQSCSSKSLSKNQTSWQEDALFIEQTMLHERFKKEFSLLLTELCECLQEHHKSSLTPAYISYAASIKKHETWTNLFIRRLAEDLQGIGLPVKIDWDGGVFRKNFDPAINEAEKFLVIGTESFLQQYQQKKLAIYSDLAKITQASRDQVIPVLLSGTPDVSFPIWFQRYSKRLEFSDYSSIDHKGYLYHLRELTAKVCDLKKDWAFDIWNKHKQNPTMNPFFRGLNEKAVEYFQKQKGSFKAIDQEYYTNQCIQLVSNFNDFMTKKDQSYFDQVVRALENWYNTPDHKTIPRLLNEKRPLSIEHHYTQLVIIKDGQEEKKKNQEDQSSQEKRVESFQDRRPSSSEDISGSKKPIDLGKLFDRSEAKEDPKRLLLLGRAGIGKSTVCRYIAYQWSHQKLWNDRFDAIFWIPLRKLRGIKAKDIYEAIQELCLCPDDRRKISSSRIESYLETHQGRVLLILDGYDELAPLLADKRLFNLFEAFKHQTHWILTSRPNAASGLHAVADRALENRAFSL